MPSADPPEGVFRRLGERSRFEGGFFEVVTATFVGPDGFTFEREVIRHPGAVCVVALEGDRRSVLMVRQYRGAVDSPLLELPAGKRDVPDEDPALCASRELAEEIGREASSMKEVARFYNSPGISDEETICYLAEGLRVVPREAHGVEEEHLVVERISLADVEELMATGDLVDAKSIIGLLAARRAVGWVTRSPGIAPTPIGGAHAAGHVRAATAAPPEAPPVSTDLEAGGGGQ
ncbi:MAG: NUDIX hydrolase [Acidimicrobiales bacterium]|jgi:ADP-ribose pyrophosphatase